MGKKKNKKKMQKEQKHVESRHEEIVEVSPQKAFSAKICFALCFLTHIALYLMTLCPTVYAGDAGQFLAVVHTMGIAHPPGHPTYILIGKLFDLIPFGGPAFGLNFMSAFFGAMSASLLFLCVRRIIGNIRGRDTIAFLAAVFFGTSRAFWEYSLFAETYTLNMFFVAVLTLIVLKIKEDRTEKAYSKIALFGFLAGIGAGNHPVLLFWVPVFVVIMLIYRRDLVFSLRAVRNVIFSGFAGLSIYFYVYFRGMAGPQFDVCRITSFRKFLYTLTAGQYGNVPMADVPVSFRDMISRMIDGISWGALDFTAAVWILTLISFLAAFRKYCKTLLPFILPVIMIIAAGLLNPAARFSLDRSSYGIGAFFVFSLWIGAGLAAISGKISSIKRKYLRTVISSVSLIAVAFSASGQLGANYMYADKSSQYLAYDAGVAVLETMEENAVLFIQKDWISFSMAYLTAVEGMRPDVTIYNRSTTMFPNLPGLFDVPMSSIYEVMRRSAMLEDEFIKNTDRPVYFDDRKSMANLPGYKIYSRGLLYKVAPVHEEEGFSPFSLYYIRNLTDPPDHKNLAEARIFIDYYVHLAEDLFSMNEEEKALKALERAEFYASETFSEKQNIMLVYVDRGYYEKALALLEEQVLLLPGYAATYKKIGILYAQYLDDPDNAVRYLSLYLEKHPFAHDRQAVTQLIGRLSR